MAMSKTRRNALQRIRRQIRRSEGRGYRYSGGFKESLSSLSTEQLQELTNKEVYRHATYYDEAADRIISGNEARTVERRAAQREKAGTLPGEDQEQMRERLMYERLRREYDNMQKSAAAKFEEGDIVMDRIAEIIEQYPTPGARYLTNMLDRQTKLYGVEAVTRALAQAPENAIQLSQYVLFYQGNSGQIHAAIREMANIIKGGVIDTQKERERFAQVQAEMAQYEG